MSRFLFAAALAAVGAGATAQSGKDAGTRIEYRSAFEGYRGWSAQAPRNWREVNDEVERLGGHAGHLRTGPPAGSKPPVAPAGKAAATPPVHGHHGSTAPEPRR